MAKAARSTKPAKPEAVLPGGDYYEEWNVRIEGGKAVKTDISRKVVKISDFEAETLNAGILSGGNTHAKMYFKVKGNAKAAEVIEPEVEIEPDEEL